MDNLMMTRALSDSYGLISNSLLRFPVAGEFPLAIFNASSLTPTEDALAAIEQAFAVLQDWLTEIVATETFQQFAVAFCAPGLYVLERCYFTPDSRAEWLFAWSFSDFFWATALRTTWVVVGGAFGLYNPERFRLWLWLFPFSYIWRWLYSGIWLRIAFWWEEMFRFRHTASARFAGCREVMALVYRQGMAPLGNLRVLGIGLFQSVAMRMHKHWIMVAGTGGGKTTFLITLLGLGKAFPCFVIDPKGQMAAALAKRLGKGGQGIKGKGLDTHFLDPKRTVRGQTTSSWNVFDEIFHAVERRKKRNQEALEKARKRGKTPPNKLLKPEDAAVIYALRIADGLVVRHGKDSAYWSNSAKDFLVGLILYVYLVEPPERRNLVRLYSLLCNGLPEETPPGRNPFDVLLFRMTQMQDFVGVIAASASTLANTAKETRGSIIGTMMEALKWLKNPAIRAICLSSDFQLASLKDNLALFLCAPTSDIRGEMSGWFRLLTILTLTIFEELQHVKSKLPCWLILDEGPSLGKIEFLETAAAVLRSYGVRLLFIAQDLGQIRTLYDNWQTFLSNAAAITFLSVADPETLNFIEQNLGKARVRRKLGRRWYRPFSAEPPRVTEDEHVIMTSDQIARFLSPERGNLIVMRSGARPLKLKVAPYFKALPIHFYEADPDYPEAPLRALTRKARALLHTFLTRLRVLQRKARALLRRFLTLRVARLKPSKQAQFAATTERDASR